MSRTFYRTGALREPSASAGHCGASLVEFAIVLPILLCLLLGIFEFARIVLIRNILATSISRTASLAAVVHGLDSYGQPDSDAERAAAIEQIRSKARALPLSTIIGDVDSGALAQLTIPESITAEAGTLVLDQEDPLEILIPAPGSGETMDQALRSRPITLKLHAKVTSILPLIQPIDLTTTVSFFREPKTYSSEPIGLDCRGNPIQLGVPVDCPCTDQSVPHYSNKVIDPATGKCVCPGDLIGESCMTCPEPLSRVEDKCECLIACDNSTERRVSRPCSCQPLGCPLGYIPQDGICVCDASTCQANQFADPVSCECRDCPPPKTVINGTTCACPSDPLCLGEDEYQDPNDGCSCKKCPSEQIATQNHMACRCPGNQAYQQNHCRCDIEDCKAKNGVLAWDRCECLPCPADRKSDGWSCICTPATIAACRQQGMATDQETCQCKPCESQYQQVTEWGYCTNNNQCPPETKNCQPNQYFSSWSCKCYNCPGAQMVNQYGNCECPDFAATRDRCKAEGKQFNWDTCDCGESCPPPKQSNGYGCQCPASAEMPSSSACVYGLGKQYDYETCACTACNENQYLPPYSSRCACKPEVVCDAHSYLDSSCHCQPCDGGVQDPSDPYSCTACELQDCPPNAILDTNTCSCKPCGTGLIANAAGTHCICDPATSPRCQPGWYNAHWDEGYCDCFQCSSGQNTNADGDGCDCSQSSMRPSDCGSRQFYDTSKCACTDCPPNKVPNPEHTSCICGEALDLTNGNCACPAANASRCPAGTYLTSWCGCSTCATGWKPNAAQTGCVCDLPGCPADKYLDSSKCECKSCTGNFTLKPDQTGCDCFLQCGSGTAVNTSTCACDSVCKGYATWNGSECVCPAAASSNCSNKQTFNSAAGVCACENHGCTNLQYWDAQNNVCACPATYNCGQGQYFDQQSCSCKPHCNNLAVWSDTDQACTCPSTLSSNCTNKQGLNTDPNICKCETKCYNLATWDTTTSACVCPSTLQSSCSPQQKLITPTCYCGGFCPEPATYNPQTDACDCPQQVLDSCNDQQLLRNCKCVDACLGNKKANSTHTTCECPLAQILPTCLANQRVNLETCECEDCSPKQRAGDGTECACVCNPNAILVDGQNCGCQNCPGGMVAFEGMCSDPACANGTKVCSTDADGNFIPIENE